MSHENEVFQRWHWYFEDEYTAADARIPVIDMLVTFFAEAGKELFERNAKCVTVDYEILRQKIPVADFESVLKDEPLTVLSCLGLATHAVLDRDEKPAIQGKINFRLRNYKPITPMRSLKSNYVDKFVSLTGNVVRASEIKPLVTRMSFECQMCGERYHRTFPEGKYNPPTMCQGKCKSKVFLPDRSTAQAMDWQRVRIQEVISTGQIDQGRVPRTMECELTADLVDGCIPGDIITVTGVVKARKTDVRGARGRSKSLFQLYIDVNNIGNANQSESGKLGMFAFRDKDFSMIVEIKSQPNLFKFMVHSLCPGIYGNDVVKAGLLLGLFGGVQKNVNNIGKLPIRGDPHVLVVGDPGLGKSQMLRAVSNIAPRGVYVCGNTASTSGLTVTLVKEAGGAGDYAIEAGALVLADQGVCCIDEFDKMSNEHNALLEAMEQQSISIAKAGIVCSLSARTSVIAAANPVKGHYDKSRTVAENLKIPAPLLSRFDIVFILLDKPDASRDQLLSEHVLALHSGPRRHDRIEFGSSRLTQSVQSQSTLEWNAQKPLSERLKLERGERIDALPPQLMRKYIAYARKYTKPILTDPAKEVLQDFYLKLRSDNQGSDGTPITTRQLESLIRLAEARAKLELRTYVTAEDALDVVDIMKESLFDVYSDEFGQLDFRRASGMSKSKQVQMFVRALHKEAEKKETAVFRVEDMYRIAQKMSLGVDQFDQFVDMLNDQNFLLKKGPRKYQLQSSSYSQ